MKSRFLKIILEQNESFTCREWRIPRTDMTSKPVYISEYVIMLIVKSRGLRFVGDSVERFQDGDLSLIGPNLPAYWGDLDTSRLQAHYVTSSFSENFLGAEFLAAPEMAPVRQLLVRARRGLSFSPKTSKKVAPMLKRMIHAEGWQRLRVLLDILDILAHAPNAHPLVSPGFSPLANEKDAGRLNAVCTYIQTSFKEKIRREKAAALAGLSIATFSRYFHKQMGKTFEAYIKDVRVGQACHKLLEEDSTIAQIAFETGFNTLSNFNHHFRTVKGMTPREYRCVHAEKTSPDMPAT